MLKPLGKLMHWLLCLIRCHDWTCRAGEGIKVPENYEPSMKQFTDYATMYCKHCLTVSDKSNDDREYYGLPKLKKVEL